MKSKHSEQECHLIPKTAAIHAYHPDNAVFLGNISDGKADNHALQYVIDQILRGIATDKAKSIRCFERDKQITLEELITQQNKPINWPEQKSRINKWLNDDDEPWTLGRIAKEFGVSKSTLSMANRKHKLYIPRSGANVTRERAIERRLRRTYGNLAERNPQSNTNAAGAFNGQRDMEAA